MITACHQLTVACASCHIQANAFGDVAIASDGINGSTTRHAMRLINSRFEKNFFGMKEQTH
jgi:cytochrome c peroxidase